MGWRRSLHGVDPGVETRRAADFELLEQLFPGNGDETAGTHLRLLPGSGEQGRVRYRHRYGHVDPRLGGVRDQHILTRHLVYFLNQTHYLPKNYHIITTKQKQNQKRTIKLKIETYPFEKN